MSPTPKPRPIRNAAADPNRAGRDPLRLEQTWAFLLGGQGWHREARCRGRATAGDDPWFASHTGKVSTHMYTGDALDGSLSAGQRRAVATCALCPVTRECLLSALEPARRTAGNEGDARFSVRQAGAEHGIFAGVTGQERVGKTTADVDELLAFAKRRAVEQGLAPADILEMT